ncbi:pyridoxal biosynthesis lyase PdxS [Campylobacter sputorum]|uniref:pyridoxal biosynthesis lyase PdxS n=1 Tax=Campylobacter sputorum TaxID=206 RepID=UPI00053BF941|nr:pyridoxal biosynthesis lyase PdxS [Campylobacter sputorum]
MDIYSKLLGGVIMDVTDMQQAKIAQDAGAVAVMALERVPADIRAAGGVSRMSDPKMIEDIMKAVSIPVMAKVRIGHFVEAQVLESLGIDFIDESEVLSPADDSNHIDKKIFKTPFVCGARNLGEALRRVNEGAKMIRTKGEAGTGGVATPADAALMRQLGAEGVFVGSGIFKSGNPAKRANAIVKAVANYNNPDVILEVSKDLGEAMVGINEEEIKTIMSLR